MPRPCPKSRVDPNDTPMMSRIAKGCWIIGGIGVVHLGLSFLSWHYLRLDEPTDFLDSMCLLIAVTSSFPVLPLVGKYNLSGDWGIVWVVINSLVCAICIYLIIQIGVFFWHKLKSRTMRSSQLPPADAAGSGPP